MFSTCIQCDKFCCTFHFFCKQTDRLFTLISWVTDGITKVYISFFTVSHKLKCRGFSSGERNDHNPLLITQSPQSLTNAQHCSRWEVQHNLALTMKHTRSFSRIPLEFKNCVWMCVYGVRKNRRNNRACTHSTPDSNHRITERHFFD